MRILGRALYGALFLFVLRRVAGNAMGIARDTKRYTKPVALFGEAIMFRAITLGRELQMVRSTKSAEEPPGESRKRTAFKRITHPRLENVLHDLDLLGMMSDKTRYEFGEDDIALIEIELKAKVDETLEKFKRGNPRPVVRFK